MKLNRIAMAAAVALAAAVPLSAMSQTAVKLELGLLVDVSGSVNSTEFDLQKNGYVNAFNDAAIQASIASGNSLAVSLFYWSGASEQSQAVAWTLVSNAAQASAFAAAIAATTRPFSGNTAPGSAINFAAPTFFSNAFTSDRQVIDVSGDGAQNAGADTLTARNAALALGIDQINGLPILGEAGLLTFYQNNIQGGAGSFTTAANSFTDFDAAVRFKIGKEIVSGIPEPETYAMMLAGLAALGFVGRRRKPAY